MIITKAIPYDVSEAELHKKFLPKLELGKEI
jgi:hypothetical protein